MTCRLCKEPKTWHGDARTCGFDHFGIFRRDNWNCGTLNALREELESPKPNRVAWSEDQSAGLLPFGGRFILLTWYKNRGRTEGAYVVNDERTEWLTIQEAEDFLASRQCAAQGTAPSGAHGIASDPAPSEGAAPHATERGEG